MKSKNVSFPHPVLGTGMCYKLPLTADDIELCVNQSDSQKYKFLLKLKQPSKNMSNYLESNKAEYYCEVDCSETFYRVGYTSDKPAFEIEVPRKSIYGEVIFSCSIVAKQQNNGKALLLKDINSEWHEDFKGFAFDVLAGEPLAIYPTKKFPVNLKFEKLYAAGSYIQVDKTDKPFPWIDLTEDKILIMLPLAQYKKFEKMHNDKRFAAIFRGSFILNALNYALHHVGEDQFKDKLWAQCICQRVRTENALSDYTDVLTGGSTEARIFALAHAILGDPYASMLDVLKAM